MVSPATSALAVVIACRRLTTPAMDRRIGERVDHQGRKQHARLERLGQRAMIGTPRLVTRFGGRGLKHEADSQRCELIKRVGDPLIAFYIEAMGSAESDRIGYHRARCAVRVRCSRVCVEMSTLR